MRSKLLYFICGVVLGGIVGLLGGIVYKVYYDSKVLEQDLGEKKIQCEKLGEKRKETAPLVDKVFYSKRLNSCIVGQSIYNGGEPIYELIDIINKVSLGSFSKYEIGDSYHKKYLDAVEILE